MLAAMAHLAFLQEIVPLHLEVFLLVLALALLVQLALLVLLVLLVHLALLAE